MTPFLITAFATIFVVIDPPGLVPLFIALTLGMDARQRRAMAQRACIIAAVLRTLFGRFGAALLGRTGTVVITRLLGMLPAALSVQFVIDGIRGTGLIG